MAETVVRMRQMIIRFFFIVINILYTFNSFFPDSIGVIVNKMSSPAGQAMRERSGRLMSRELSYECQRAALYLKRVGTCGELFYGAACELTVKHLCACAVAHDKATAVDT